MKQDWEIYRDTEMLGAYHPECAVLRETEGGVTTVFRDTEHWNRSEGFVRERSMVIGGKCFRITSVFPDDASVTPTDKLLRLIDAELEKEAHAS